MAEKRMFSKTIVDSDAFLEMPLSAQALYFHLSMRADDDGFLNNAKKIMRTINANQNDYDLLIAKAFIIQFDDGICVIKHWRINNYLRSDRYKPTIYQEQKNMLEIKDNGRYSLINQDGIPNGYQCVTQNSIDKNSIDKINNIPTQKTEYSFEIHTNLENTLHVLNSKEYSEWEYILANPDLYQSIKEWMTYKDAKKPKRNNHYANQLSITKLLNKFVKSSKEYGVQAVVDVVNDSIAGSYMGIVWDWVPKRAETKPKQEAKSRYADAIERMNKHMEERTKEIGDVDLGDFY